MPQYASLSTSIHIPAAHRRAFLSNQLKLQIFDFPSYALNSLMVLSNGVWTYTRGCPFGCIPSIREATVSMILD